MSASHQQDQLEPDHTGSASQMPVSDEWESEQEEWDREQPSATSAQKITELCPIDRYTSLRRGIMLLPTSSGMNNEYRRVGYFELDKNEMIGLLIS